MKKILFVVSDYLPNRNGGTIRIEKLIKYIPMFDFEGVVLTKKGSNLKSKEVIGETLIYRTKAFDTPALYQKIKKFFKRNKIPRKISIEKSDVQERSSNDRMANYFFVPDVDIFWAVAAFWKTKSILRKLQIDIIYSSAPNYSSHILALLQSWFGRKNLQWIAEFRDPWTFNPFRSPKPYLLDRLEHYLEKLVVKYSNKIIVTSDVYKEKFLEKYTFLNKEKIECIPNGYDPEDFKELEIQEKSASGIIKILHAGNFYGKRSVKPFLVALESFKQSHPDLANKIEVIQYGTLDPIGKAYLDQHPNAMFKVYSAISHKESLKEICSADWLLLIPGPGSGTTTGKVYEYLASKNPIIALVDEGSAKDLIDELEVGYTIGVEDKNGIVTALTEMASCGSKYSKQTELNVKIRKFDRKVIAERICKYLIT